MLEGVRGCGVGKMLVFTITMSMCHVCSTISFAHAKARDCWSKVTALEWSWLAIRNVHIKRCNSLGEMIGAVAQPWASVLCRLGV